MPSVVRFACGKTSTNNRVDAAVIHYLWEETTSLDAQCKAVFKVFLKSLAFVLQAKLNKAKAKAEAKAQKLAEKAAKLQAKADWKAAADAGDSD